MVIHMEMLKVVEQYYDDFLGHNNIVYEYYDDDRYLGEFKMFAETNYIHSLRIMPWERRKGYGTRMLEALFAEHPHTTFSLHVEVTNEAAVAMYEKLGFELVSTGMAWGRYAHEMIKRGV